jgi:hypothetical protein
MPGSSPTPFAAAHGRVELGYVLRSLTVAACTSAMVVP